METIQTKELTFNQRIKLYFKLMSKENAKLAALELAELVLPIFEKEFPDNKRPKNAIEAARNYLKDSTETNKEILKDAINASAKVCKATNTVLAAKAANSAANDAYCAAYYAAYVAANSAVNDAAAAYWAPYYGAKVANSAAKATPNKEKEIEEIILRYLK